MKKNSDIAYFGISGFSASIGAGVAIRHGFPEGACFMGFAALLLLVVIVILTVKP